MQSKAEFLKKAEQEYEELCMCENHAQKLQFMLDFIRTQGFKVIVLGSTVKVTRKRGH